MDIPTFVERYYSQIEAFYAWLLERQRDVHKIELEQVERLQQQALRIYARIAPDDPRIQDPTAGLPDPEK